MCVATQYFGCRSDAVYLIGPVPLDNTEKTFNYKTTLLELPWFIFVLD